MSEGPVTFKNPDGLEVELLGADVAGVVPSNDLRITVRHDPFGEDDVAVVTQRVGDRDIDATLYPGESVELGGGSEIFHKMDL